jgi:hypothetical protein
MMATFEFFYRQLARATVTVLFAALAFLGLTLLCALLGFSHAVVSFRGVSVVLGYVFGGMLAVFLLTSLVGALVRFLDRRSTRA